MSDIIPSVAVPSDFPGVAKDTAYLMAKSVNCWLEYGSWKEVIAQGIVAQPTLWRYQQNEAFKACVDRLFQLVTHECKDTLVDLMRNGRQDIKMKASSYLLEALESSVFDSGVRREKARAVGNASTIAFASSLTPDKIKALQESSPFALAKNEAQAIINASKIEDNPPATIMPTTEKGESIE